MDCRAGEWGLQCNPSRVCGSVRHPESRAPPAAAFDRAGRCATVGATRPFRGTPMIGTRFGLLALAAGLAAAPAAAAPKLAPDPFDGVVWTAYDKAAGPHYQVQTSKSTQAMKV